MAMTEVPNTEPPGVKDSDWWAWNIWFFKQFGTYPTAYYIDNVIAPPIRFINFASRGDHTAILIKYDSNKL